MDVLSPAKVFGVALVIACRCTGKDLLDVRNDKITGLFYSKEQLFLVTKEALRVYKLVGENSDIHAELIGSFRPNTYTSGTAEVAELRMTGDHSFIYCWHQSCR